MFELHKNRFHIWQMCADALRANKKAFVLSSSLLLLAAFLDGFSIVALLPMLELATSEDTSSIVLQSSQCLAFNIIHP